MNVVFLVVDSLRARSLFGREPGAPLTPFFARLARETVHYRRAYATECWTLPSHTSMFTGLLPSEHGAHFRTMAYRRGAATVAERFAAAGYATEIVTRNSLLDGTVPGVTRGFQRNTKLLAELRGIDPLGLLLALSKPRVRRLIQTSGFFHVLQRENGAFLRTLARMIIPADRLVLDYVLEQMAQHRRSGRPYFLFANLYDVHAPYPPSEDSPLAPFDTLAGWVENLMLPRLSTQLGAHAYLRDGFRFSPRAQRILRRRYQRAVERMDAKLAVFWDAAHAAGLLDHTLVVVTSDHGEAFGEHDLYFHDASVFDTHLHVPLFVHHPGVSPSVVDEVVSTRSLADLLVAAAERGSVAGTILSADTRAASPIALAEHFHYPHLRDANPRWMQDVAAAVAGRWKCQVRREGVSIVDLAADPQELAPVPGTIEDFAALARAEGIPGTAVAKAALHLRRWERWTPTRESLRGVASPATLAAS